MSEQDKDAEKRIKIKRPKRRVQVPVKTGTVVHKSRKAYTRKDKHKKGTQDVDKDESDSDG